MASWDWLWNWLGTGTPPTYIAVVVASVAARFAYKSSVASTASAATAAAQLERLQDERASDQASKIAVWSTTSGPVSHAVDPNDATAGRAPYSNAFGVRFVFRNASTLPIYDVGIYVESNVKYLVGMLGLVAPTISGTATYSATFVANEVDPYFLRLGTLFIDAQGFYWDRAPNGLLVRNTEDEHRKKMQEITESAVELRDSLQLANKDRDRVFRVVPVSGPTSE